MFLRVTAHPPRSQPEKHHHHHRPRPRHRRHRHHRRYRRRHHHILMLSQKRIHLGPAWLKNGFAQIRFRI